MRSRPAATGALAAAVALLALPLAAQDAAAGKRKARMCAGCHGMDGLAVLPDAPHLAGEHPMYLTRQLEAFRSGTRTHEQMTIVAQGLSDEDIADLAAWFSSIEITATPPDLD